MTRTTTLMLASIALMTSTIAQAQVAGSTVVGSATAELRKVTAGWSATRQVLGQTVFNDKTQGRRSSLDAFCYDWLLRGCKRTFSPFHRRVVTTYALEVGAAGDGDYRDQSFSAFRAARCSIHEILPIFNPNQKLKLLFQLGA